MIPAAPGLCSVNVYQCIPVPLREGGEWKLGPVKVELRKLLQSQTNYKVRRQYTDQGLSSGLDPGLQCSCFFFPTMQPKLSSFQSV